MRERETERERTKEREKERKRVRQLDRQRGIHKKKSEGRQRQYGPGM